MIIYKKDVPIYCGELIIVFNDDFNESIKKFKVEVDEIEKANGWSIELENSVGYNRWMILLKENSKHSIIAHESLHTVNRILDNRGVLADHQNDEAACYLMSYIVKEIYTFAKKNNIVIEI